MLPSIVRVLGLTLVVIVLLGVTLLALGTLRRFALASLFVSWPILTAFLGLRTPRPSGFELWAVFVMVLLCIVSSGVLIMRRSRSRTTEAGSQSDVTPECVESLIAAGERSSLPIHVHLIPGTWAHGMFAPWFPARGDGKPLWFEEGSEFRCKLLSGLQGLGKVSFSTLAWSERNRLGARSDAAKQFSANLKSSLETSSTALHVIVAHSHGGNIAVSALRTLSVPERGRIRGIVTMGTPFLWFERRQLGVVAEGLLSFAKLVVAIYVAVARVAGGFMLLLLPLIIFDALPGWFSPLPVIVSLLIVAAALLYGEYQRGKETYRLATDTRASTKDDELPPMLVLRSPDDEASKGMRVGQTLGRFLLFVWTALDALSTIPRDGKKVAKGRLIWRIGVLLGIVLIVRTLGIDEAFRSSDSAPGATPNPITQLFQLFAVGYIGLTIFIIAIGLLAGIPLAGSLGAELLSIPLGVVPYVEDMPTGVPVRGMNLPGEGFRHKVYSRPEAPVQTASFIRDVAVTEHPSAAIAS